MLLHHLALALSALVSTGTPQEGEQYLKKAEERLYRWPAPGVLVRFEARTDVLAPMVAQMKSDLAQRADPDAARLVVALERMTVQGTIDTATGKVTADVRLDYTSPDARALAAVEELKKRVATTVTGSFQGIPLQDPSLMHAGSTVTACEENAGSILVTLTNTQGGTTTRLSLNGNSLLPERVETPLFTGVYRYEESFPGRFALARLDMTPRRGPESHAEYTYQKQGELLFPAGVKVTTGEKSATITFGSLVVEKRPPG